MQPILRPAEMEAFKAMDIRGWSTQVGLRHLVQPFPLAGQCWKCLWW